MKAPENPPMAELPDTQRVGLGHQRHTALEASLGLGLAKAWHQQMQHQHAGDFIGMDSGLQVHLRPLAAALETPGADLQVFTVVAPNTERNIPRHSLALPSETLKINLSSASTVEI